MSAVTVEGGLLRIGDHAQPMLAGEIQFWRMHPDTWEPAVRAAKSSGITLVSTYLSWRRHEPVQGSPTFEGELDPRLDLLRFLRICAEVGVWVQLKPGPWICAEEPGGGYPDWLLENTGLLARDDAGEIVIGYNPPFQHPVPSYSNPEYLRIVKDWFADVWGAIGDFVFPAGPVVAIQLDNEPSLCFQDSLYGADYSDTSIDSFRQWLGERYDADTAKLRKAWGSDDDFETAHPPRRPTAGRGPEVRRKLHDWTLFKTVTTGDYLASLKRMHIDLGGHDLLYTVNIVTHPIHDVPVSHAAMRAATGAAIGEDHYYIPPLDSAAISRLARSAATARAAGEPLPWVPELQAGIWRSPGEVIEYPDPTPLEQEIWWGAAIALGFGGANLYMLADRENWEHAPLSEDGEPTAFFDPVERLQALTQAHGESLSRPLDPAVVVAWHRADAYDAYAVTGTSRIPDVPWHSPQAAAAYRSWDDLIQLLTRYGIPYDLWDTAAGLPDVPTDVPLVVPAGCGVSDAQLATIARSGRSAHRLSGGGEDWISSIRSSTAHVTVDGIPADDTLVVTRTIPGGSVVHIVHWGGGAAEATLVMPTLRSGVLRPVGRGEVLPIEGIGARIPLAKGHRVYAVGTPDGTQSDTGSPVSVA